MISISHPVLFHLYRLERDRPVKQVVESGAGVSKRMTASQPDFSVQNLSDGEGSDFQTFFFKALEKMK